MSKNNCPTLKLSSISIIVSFVILFSVILILKSEPANAIYQLQKNINLSAVDASYLGLEVYHQSGHAVSSAGDINNDGYDDFMTSSCSNDSNTGMTYLFFGKSTGWSMDSSVSTADVSFVGENSDDYSGNDMAGVGDVNNDGYDDFVISAYYNSDVDTETGKVYLILGKESGWSTNTNLSTADASWTGEITEDWAGESVAGGGDFNNDGYDDIIISAFGWDIPEIPAEEDYCGNDCCGEEEDEETCPEDCYEGCEWCDFEPVEEIPDAGQVYIIFGKSSGWTTDESLADADASFIATDTEFLGFSSANAGDVNNDGYDDILLGTDGCGAYLFFGKQTGWAMKTSTDDADVKFERETAGDLCGYAVSGAGDINGDGYDDLLIGSSYSNENGYHSGQAYITLGKSSGWSSTVNLGSTDASLLGESAEDCAGQDVAPIGDIDEDGYDDFIVGVNGYDDDFESNGAVYLIKGKAEGWSMDTSLSTAHASFIGEDHEDYIGIEIASAGDINGDGYDDMIFGTYWNRESFLYSGQTYIVLAPTHTINNTSPGITPVLTSDWTTDVSTAGQAGVKEVGIVEGTDRIATLDIDFVDERNWQDITAGSNSEKSFLHYPSGFSDIPGSEGSGFTLYIPIPINRLSEEVIICPNASNFSNISQSCTGAITKTLSDPDTSQVTIGNKKYWKVENLTGTGGLSLLGGFDLRDTMTRLEVSQLSDHSIEFGTINGLLLPGETIEITLDPSGQNWSFGSIDVGDIDLEDDGSDLTLCTGSNPCSAGVDIWGVNINSTTDTITFTAPTNTGSGQFIAANSTIKVEIGNNATSQSAGNAQITNPATTGQYEIHMEITNSIGTETGEVEIPIVDDDTVNITSYIDTLLSFDIDTAASNTHCDASGGASPCDSHSSASDDSGYVVDLGEMTLTSVNRSGDNVLHSDGLTGNVNYIWFDLESNANGGTSVTLVSSNESLYKDASNEIPDVAGGSEQQITSASGLYGLNHRSGFTNSTTTGTINIHTDCDCTSGDDYYCDVSDGGTPVEIFNSNNNPVADGRVQWAVGAAPDSSDGTGTYMDQLTFVATSNF